MKKVDFRKMFLYCFSVCLISTFLSVQGFISSDFSQSALSLRRTKALSIYSVEHYFDSSEPYTALQSVRRLVLGGSTLLREGADVIRAMFNQDDIVTLGTISTVTDDGGSTAMLVAAIQESPYFRTAVFGMGDIINNWVGFTDPVMQRFLEVRVKDFSGQFTSALVELGLSKDEVKELVKLTQKSLVFSQGTEDLFLNGTGTGTVNGLSKGLLEAIKIAGAKNNNILNYRDEIIRVGLEVFSEIKSVHMSDKLQWAFSEVERAVAAGELAKNSRVSNAYDAGGNPIDPITELPANWAEFKSKLMDLATVVDTQFIDRGVFAVDGQSLRNLIVVGAMYVAGYLNESQLDENGDIVERGYIDESKLNDVWRVIGGTFGVTELGFAAPVAHNDAMLASVGQDGSVITTQTDISRFPSSQTLRSPVDHVEFYRKIVGSDGRIQYSNGDITYDGDVKPDSKPGGEIVASEQALGYIANTQDVIFLTCGSAFTSVAPVLMTKGIPEALAARRAEGLPVVLFIKPFQDSETVGLDIHKILKALEKSMQIATKTELSIGEVISEVVLFKTSSADFEDHPGVLAQFVAGRPSFNTDGSMNFDFNLVSDNVAEGDSKKISVMFGEKTLRGFSAVVEDSNDPLLGYGAELQSDVEAQLTEMGIGVRYLEYDALQIYWPGTEGEAAGYADDWLDYPAGFGVHGGEEVRIRFSPEAIYEAVDEIVEDAQGVSNP